MNIAPRRLELSLLPGRFAISKLAPDAPLPAWAVRGSFSSVTRTCDDLKVHGPFVLSEVGVLASLATPLADARVSVFVVSTFDTDYLLVTEEQLTSAIVALGGAGHSIHRSEHE